MRTVDPDLWYPKVRKPPLNISRPLKLGLKGLSPFETRLRRSFRDAMMEYLKNCSVQGVAYVRDRNNPTLLRLNWTRLRPPHSETCSRDDSLALTDLVSEHIPSTPTFSALQENYLPNDIISQWCYLLVVLATIGAAIALLVFNVYLGTAPRLTVRVQHETYAVARDFPAVAVCSYNLISRFALDDYAQYIYSLDINNTYSLEAIKENLLAFGALHSRRHIPFDINFETYLEKIAHETNVTNILYKLSPDCSRILVHCSWDARRLNCGRLFAKRITNTGFCCVFNSRYHDMDRHNPVHASRLAGERGGLVVAVRERPGDVTLLRRPLDGVDIHIFDGWQYPAARAGVVTAVPAPRRALLTARLRPRVQVAGQSLWRHSDSWLGCRLRRDALPWARCVSLCRARAARALCRCAPHSLPPFRSDAAPLCSLQHLACLDKYSDKLTSLHPGDAAYSAYSAHSALREERADSTECAECRLDCARASYRAALSVSPLAAGGRGVFLGHVLKDLDLTNTTVVRIFYTSEDIDFYVLETNMRWYGVVARLGSQWAVLAGAPALAALELLFHCVLRGGLRLIGRRCAK